MTDSAHPADDAARRQALLTALTTEHFVMQTASNGTITEAASRTSLFVMTLSSALVAMGFAARSPELLVPFVATVLPAVFLLGVLTVFRLVDTVLENLQYLAAIARIRAHYRTLAPEAPALFSAAAGRWPESPSDPSHGLGQVAAMFGTSAAMVASIDALVAGAGVALLVVNLRGRASMGFALAAGAAAAAGLIVAFYRFQRWRFASFGARLDAIAGAPVAPAGPRGKP